jgi:hypothetical protein
MSRKHDDKSDHPPTLFVRRQRGDSELALARTTSGDNLTAVGVTAPTVSAISTAVKRIFQQDFSETGADPIPNPVHRLVIHLIGSESQPQLITHGEGLVYAYAILRKRLALRKIPLDSFLRQLISLNTQIKQLNIDPTQLEKPMIEALAKAAEYDFETLQQNIASYSKMGRAGHLLTRILSLDRKLHTPKTSYEIAAEQFPKFQQLVYEYQLLQNLDKLLAAEGASDLIKVAFRKLTEFDLDDTDNPPPFKLLADAFYYLYYHNKDEEPLAQLKHTDLECQVMKLLAKKEVRDVLGECLLDSPNAHPSLFVEQPFRCAFAGQSPLYRYQVTLPGSRTSFGASYANDDLITLSRNYFLKPTEFIAHFTIELMTARTHFKERGSDSDKAIERNITYALDALSHANPRTLRQAIEVGAIPVFLLENIPAKGVIDSLNRAIEYMDDLIISPKAIKPIKEAWDIAAQRLLVIPLRQHLKNDFLTSTQKVICELLLAELQALEKPGSSDEARRYLHKCLELIKPHLAKLQQPAKLPSTKNMQASIEQHMTNLRLFTYHMLAKPVALNELHALHCKLAMLSLDLVHLEQTTPNHACDQLNNAIKRGFSILDQQLNIVEGMMREYPGVAHIARSLVLNNVLRCFGRIDDLVIDKQILAAELPELQHTFFMNYVTSTDAMSKLSVKNMLLTQARDDTNFARSNRELCGPIERGLLRVCPEDTEDTETKLRTGIDTSYLITLLQPKVTSVEDLHDENVTALARVTAEMYYLAQKNSSSNIYPRF